MTNAITESIPVNKNYNSNAFWKGYVFKWFPQLSKYYLNYLSFLSIKKVWRSGKPRPGTLMGP